MKRTVIDRYTGPTTLAIDVSHHQGVIDWPRVAAGEATIDGRSQGRARLAIIRTGDGRDTDRRAVANLRGAHEAGLPCAVYHYIRGRWPAEVQVEIAREVIAVAGVPVAWVALDLEGAPAAPGREGSGAWLAPQGGPELSTLEVLQVLGAMRRLLEARGHRVVLYTGVAWHWYVAHSTDARVRELAASWADVELWTPYYTTGAAPGMPVDPQGRAAPWSAWILWQYSSKGRINGTGGDVDLNRFRGDEAELERWLAAGAPKPEPRTEASRDLEQLASKYAAQPEIVRVLYRAIGELTRCGLEAT